MNNLPSNLTARDTFKQWANKLLHTKQAQGVGISYLNTLEYASKHLLPLFPLPLNDIQIDHIQSIIYKLSEPTSDSLSKRTLSGIKHFAQQVFNLAIMHRAVSYNPASYVIIPYNAPYTPHKAITEEQQRWIRELDHRAKRAAMIMLYAGLRRGEITALQWNDVNLPEGVIDISKAAEFIRGHPTIKQPKTQTSIRCVDIPKHLIDYLDIEKSLDSCPYVLHGRDGQMWTKSMWSHIWRSYMKDLNICLWLHSAGKRTNEP